MLYLIDNWHFEKGDFIVGDNKFNILDKTTTILFDKRIIQETDIELNYPTITEQEKLDLIAESDRQKANDLPDDKRLELMEKAINDLILGGM